MIARRLATELHSALAESPAVALLGPRQVGKTTLALEVAQTRPAVYLDLESEADRAKLAEPELYLAERADKLVILDEIQRTPQLFQSLRGLIDAGRLRSTLGEHFGQINAAHLRRERVGDRAARDDREEDLRKGRERERVTGRGQGATISGRRSKRWATWGLAQRRRMRCLAASPRLAWRLFRAFWYSSRAGFGSWAARFCAISAFARCWRARRKRRREQAAAGC